MFFGEAGRPVHPRSVEPGQPGDLVVLAAPPAEVLSELDSGMVAATIIAGELVYERG
jgi:imidazolonepropionase-like amidohydrolase